MERKLPRLRIVERRVVDRREGVAAVMAAVPRVVIRIVAGPPATVAVVRIS